MNTIFSFDITKNRIQNILRNNIAQFIEKYEARRYRTNPKSYVFREEKGV